MEPTILRVAPKSNRAKARLPKIADVVVLNTLSKTLEINGRVYHEPVLIECGSWCGWMCGRVDIEVVSPV